MQSSPSLSAKLTALIAFTLSGTVAASAQTPQDRNSDVPSFKKEIPAAVAPAPSDAASPQLRPIAPAPSLVVEAATPVPTDAHVIPPPPRLVKQTAGVVTLPGRSLAATGGYETSEVAISTPLQVNSGFGYRSGRMHTGIDFQASWGDSVGVSMRGTVTFAGVKHGYGNVIVVDHGDGISTYYAHLSAIYVGVGQTVAASQVIGAIGSTGRSTGPHLHYEVRVYGHPVNPTSIISFVNGEIYVNGQPFGGDTVEPAAAEPTSRAVAPAADSRPRRVAPTTGDPKRVLISSDNSLTAY
jgi:murein DD-endopeptidase MepM/ murein hydrolase activator NlpD